jgi:hypothetical protein
MLKSKGQKKAARRSTTPRKVQRGAPTASAKRLRQISQSGSQIVKDAALLLDEEIAAGIVAAKQMQVRFSRERRIDPSDFKEVLQRFRSNGHEIVNLVNDRISELRSEENAEVVKQLLNNGHSLLDLVVELVSMGAKVADQLVQSNFKRQDAGRRARQRS